MVHCVVVCTLHTLDGNMETIQWDINISMSTRTSRAHHWRLTQHADVTRTNNNIALHRIM